MLVSRTAMQAMCTSSPGRVKGLPTARRARQPLQAQRVGLHHRGPRRRAVCNASSDGSPAKPEAADDVPSTPSTSATDTTTASESAAQTADVESPTDLHEFLEASAVTAEVAQQGVDAETERFTSVQAEEPRGGAFQPGEWLNAQAPPIRFSILGAAAFAAVTLAVAIVNTVRKSRSPDVQRKRTVNKNKVVVEGIDEFLPERRQELTPGVLRALRMRTGFTEAELFRKYLWYLLRERKFDAEAVADLIHLRSALGLSDEQTAQAIQERAKRIYDKYGNIMMDVNGMTQAGIERKASCRALYAKLLYLAESEEILLRLNAFARKELVQDVFGAVEEDTNQLRIVSLYDVDLDDAFALQSSPGSEGATGEPGTAGEGEDMGRGAGDPGFST